MIAALVMQCFHVPPYTSLWPTYVELCEDTGLPVFVVNLDFRNDEHEAVRRSIEEVHPDLLPPIEIDEAWSAGPDVVGRAGPYRVDDRRENGRGGALWSRLDPEQTDYRVRHDGRSLVGACGVGQVWRFSAMRGFRRYHACARFRARRSGRRGPAVHAV